MQNGIKWYKKAVLSSQRWTRAAPYINMLEKLGLTENAGRENDGPSKLQGMKLQDMKMPDMKMRDTKMTEQKLRNDDRAWSGGRKRDNTTMNNCANC